MSSLGGQHSRSASTVGGNPINCFKLASRKTGAFLESGLVAPTFTGAQEDRCSLLPPRQQAATHWCIAHSIQSGARQDPPVPTPPRGERAAKLQRATSQPQSAATGIPVVVFKLHLPLVVAGVQRLDVAGSVISLPGRTG